MLYLLKILSNFFCLDVSKEDIKVLCYLWVSNGHRTPIKHKLRIKLWYFQIQQKRFSSFLCQPFRILALEYWQNFPTLQLAKRNLAQARKYFVYEHEETISFSQLSKKVEGKLFSYEQPLYVVEILIVFIFEK